MYPAHSTVHNLNGTYQRQQLPVILAATQAAKDKVKGVQDIARGLLGQGFYSNIIGDDASAYPSQAKKTLSRYGNRRNNRTKGRERRPLECFGCDGDHSWMKDKKIICPHGTEPAVIKRWEEIGAEGSTMTPAEVTRFIQGEIDKWTPVVKASGAKPG